MLNYVHYIVMYMYIICHGVISDYLVRCQNCVIVLTLSLPRGLPLTSKIVWHLTNLLSHSWALKGFKGRQFFLTFSLLRGLPLMSNIVWH